jgi:hypothetical protein
MLRAVAVEVVSWVKLTGEVGTQEEAVEAGIEAVEAGAAAAVVSTPLPVLWLFVYVAFAVSAMD